MCALATCDLSCFIGFQHLPGGSVELHRLHLSRSGCAAMACCSRKVRENPLKIAQKRFSLSGSITSGLFFFSPLCHAGECSVTGDMYFQSFDGRVYTFAATCQYVLAKSRSSGKFTVTIQNAPCGPVSMLSFESLVKT